MIIQHGFNDELYHHGILGMRWGVRRYQPYPKGYSGSGREVGQAKRSQKQLNKFQQRKVIKRAEKERATKLEEARKMKERLEAQRAHDENKEKVLRSGTAQDVLAYKGELSNKELREVVDRLNLERTLSEYSQRDMKTFMKSMDSAMKSLETINNWANVATDTYNVVAQIYNTTEKGKEKPMTLISKENKKKKKND